MELPLAFIHRMREQLGEGYTDFSNSLQSPPSTSIRLNPQKFNKSITTLQKVSWEPNGFYLQKRPVFTLDPLFHAGSYYVQEASSMFTGYLFKQLFNEATPLKILDLCAAPGGKTTHVASLMNQKSILVANEVIKSRAHILAENVIKWGNPNVVVTQNDPKEFKSLEGFFDVIVVDAPCSGEGLFRRDESAIGEWSVENTQLCALRQQRITADIWGSLAPGGFLIYSTCTYNPNENEKNLVWMSEQLNAKSIKVPVPEEWGIHQIEWHGMVGYQFLPHKIKGEGFFAGIVQKESEDKPFYFKVKTQPNQLSRESQVTLKEWVKEPDNVQFQIKEETIIAYPAEIESLTLYLQQKLRVLKSGVIVAEQKGKKFIPHPDFALSNMLQQLSFPKIELSHYEALQYLKKENIHTTQAVKGYHLVTYQDVPLGWTNHLGNRSNNLFPVGWRIRMALPKKEELKPPFL
ncbi:MAG: rRNA cytosine-C5-methyltransferase [Salinivirgaceae bacterium]|nr:rRNA cytosine-C5-methyltransferase [Salinivirgaceae bacterium]